MSRPVELWFERIGWMRDIEEERKRPTSRLDLAVMLVSQSDAGVGDHLADGRCAESKLLADHGEGLAVGIKLYRPFDKTGGQLVAGSQRDSTTTQMASDGVTVGAKATGQLVRR
jgi:hypothetical protein